MDIYTCRSTRTTNVGFSFTKSRFLGKPLATSEYTQKVLGMDRWDPFAHDARVLERSSETLKVSEPGCSEILTPTHLLMSANYVPGIPAMATRDWQLVVRLSSPHQSSSRREVLVPSQEAQPGLAPRTSVG